MSGVAKAKARRLKQNERPEHFANLWYPALGRYRQHEVAYFHGYTRVWDEDFDCEMDKCLLQFPDGEMAYYFPIELLRWDGDLEKASLILIPPEKADRQQKLFY